MHILMGMTRMLFKHLSNKATCNIGYASSLLTLLEQLGVHMAKKKTKSKAHNWRNPIQITVKSELLPSYSRAP
jgi:hypothetical protein